MRTRWRSLPRSTIAQFVGLIFLSQLALVGGVLYFVRQSSEATLLAEQKALVDELRDGLVAGYQEGGEPQLVKLIEARLQEVDADVPVILLTRADGSVVIGNLGAWPANVPKSTRWTTVNLFRKSADHPEQMGLMTSRLSNGNTLLTGHVIDGSVRLASLNSEAMFGALLLAIPLALLLALLLGRLINVRIRGVATTAEAVGAGDLSRRVAQDGSGDSFDTLGHGINAMLDRIETLVGELRIITDGLAHDLRSPITRLKSTLEKAMIDTRDPEALDALESVSAEAETLLAMLSTALQISRAEAGIGRERFGPTDLSTLLADLVEIYGPVAEDRAMTLSANAPQGLTASVHRELLSQALGNLIENALKYATGGRTIILSAAPKPDGIEIAVVDDGQGIAAENHAEAIKKFGRLDPARNIPGSGLGLSLVEAVAKLHGGNIALYDNAPGLKVTLNIRA
jgi:signal transduction histidine kinase